MYDKVFGFLNRFFKKSTLFKTMFNISPMYKRSCGKITFVSDDLHIVKIKIKLNYKNRNYVGSMFGGSLFSATDPIYMIQLMQILGNEFVVWDKSSEIRFKRPAYENVYANFEFSQQEIDTIKKRVESEQEMDYEKALIITNNKGIVYTELNKTLYISSKEYYKQKRKNK
jgi:acyl-coenzyme A thioesterase PaaI-like protein